MTTKLKASRALLRTLTHPSHVGRRVLGQVPKTCRGFHYASSWSNEDATPTAAPPASDTAPNPLRAYFDAHTAGRGIWKWNHYFDIYHRHFARFRGREVHILEIGIYSGGSLDLWKDYFGPQCHVYGVDIEPACKQYEDDRTRVFIGDQADRAFWQRFKTEVPAIDILIDDGGHETEQQIVTLEEMLPHIRTGGVYLCEDVTHPFNGFAAYVFGLIDNLNHFQDAAWTYHPDGTKDEVTVRATPFQRVIRSIHTYPYVTVIEKAEAPVERFLSPKHGTQWQPFL